jgi:hypothetical protein
VWATAPATLHFLVSSLLTTVTPTVLLVYLSVYAFKNCSPLLAGGATLATVFQINPWGLNLGLCTCKSGTLLFFFFFGGTGLNSGP